MSCGSPSSPLHIQRLTPRALIKAVKIEGVDNGYLLHVSSSRLHIWKMFTFPSCKNSWRCKSRAIKRCCRTDKVHILDHMGLPFILGRLKFTGWG
ncbi:hypothetical protein SERLA73DRAFT_140553 [Serpula lacrymans var. lacrymans S7.3]|uniref:Uncharacterized protein n=1 Tax=Serpula lacrymans var. lacrymans (strain S7.3) TaxID=936435 RepID=F8Q3U4_SERL3|nr:hypothetical protein SERLA73DRAFT_140553 [Serpula lacrymans var. lacrymans S7.3]